MSRRMQSLLNLLCATGIQVCNTVAWIFNVYRYVLVNSEHVTTIIMMLQRDSEAELLLRKTCKV